MSRRSDSWLARLAKRLAAAAARLDPQPVTMTVVVQESDADHPHGTRVRTGAGGWDVYWDRNAGEPELPPPAPFTTVITLVPDDPGEHQPIPWPWEMEAEDGDPDV